MHQVPNLLSAARLLLAPLFLWLYLDTIFLLKILGLTIFFVAAITDFFDGFIARKYQIETPLGTFLDPLADKFLTFAGFICLPFIHPGQFPWWAIGLIIFRDVFVTLLRLWANKKNMEMETRYMAKLKTMVQMIFLYVFLVLGLFLGSGHFIGRIVSGFFSTNIPYFLMITVTFITVYSGIEYVMANRRLFSSSPTS